MRYPIAIIVICVCFFSSVAFGQTEKPFLSDMSWASASNGWGPAEKDKSNGEQAAGDGNLIVLDGIPYAKGLGVHSSSTIDYTLNGNCSTFSAKVGVDDEAGSNGSVVFQVLADSNTIFNSGTMTGASATQTVDVSVVGATTLSLVVTDAGDGATYDHADWADAKLQCVSSQSPTVVAYDPGTLSGLTSSGKYSVSVNGTTVPVMSYGYAFGGSAVQKKHWAWFAFGNGVATVDVTYNPATITSYTVSPKRNAVAVTQPSLKVLRFKLDSPRTIILRDINSDVEAIVLIADPLETSPPTASSGVRYSGTTYCTDTTASTDSTTCLQNAINAANTAGGGTVTVSPGKFKITAKIDVKANVNLYMAPDSMIYFPASTSNMPREGMIVFGGASITGRGLLYGNGANNTYQNFLYTKGTNVVLRGFMLLDSVSTGLRLWGTNQILDRLKILSVQSSVTDGVDFTGANTVAIQDSFIISTDDNISFGFGDNAFGNDTSVPTHHAYVTRNVFWHLQTGADFKSIPCVSTEVKNIYMENNDMIAGDTLLAIYGSGTNNIHDFTIKDMRVEAMRDKPFELATPGGGFSTWGLGSCDTAANGDIHHLTIEGVQIDQTGANQSNLYGNSTYTIHDVNFGNLRLAGTLVTNATNGNMYIDTNTTSNITFSGPSAATITARELWPHSYSVARGADLSVTTHWTGGPSGTTPLAIFVHVVDGSGNIVAYEDHFPGTPTTMWYTAIDDKGGAITIPSNLATGTYRILTGLYDANGNNARLTLATGPAVTDNGDTRYEVGTVTVY